MTDLSRYQDPSAIQRVLHTARTIAIVGLSSYRSLLDVPGPVDVVNVFHAPGALPGIARDGWRSMPVPSGASSA